MSTKCSTAPVIPWNWVIQSLANFKQVDSSTLVDLVKKAPAMSDDQGKDARELVSLRILESLFVYGNEATVDTDSAQNAKICFDPSEHCEDVLRKILDKTSESMAESERQKWNVRSFLMDKRSSLPKCPLQKLKEALLEGSHPLLASLKERSKLGVANISENISSMVDINFDAQTTAAKDYLASPKPANENNKVEESLLQKLDQVENSPRGITEHIGRKECETSIEPPVKGLGENMLMDNGEHAASKKLEHSCDNANSKHDQQQPPGDDDNVPQDTYTEGHDKRVSTDSMKNLEFVGRFREPRNNTQPNVSNSGPSNELKNSMELDGQLETGTDSERSDDERTDIVAKKEAFLSSQCILSQDSMAMTDWTEISLCMKCNEGGQLLVCCSDACPLRVHESCLGSAATLDENGTFFCPFCAYSRAISNYLKVKKKASLARKDLQAFLSFGVKCRPKISSTKGAGLEKNESRQFGTLGETIEANGNGATVSRGNNINCVSSKEHCAAEPSRLCVNSELHCGDKRVHNRSLPEAEDVGQKMDEACRSPTRMEEHQPSSKEVSGCGPKSLSSKSNGRDHRIGEHADIHLNNGCLNQPTTNSPQKPIRQTRTPEQQCNEKESPVSIVSSHSRRPHKRKPQYTSPAVPLLRRKTLPWTKSEEEILKEGVQRFSSVNGKGIPWREILDFGRDVFHKGRTAIDLKDKWRNICKGSPAPKKPRL